MTEREVDALVEEKIFGYELSKCRRFSNPPMNHAIPEYSSNMGWAWKVFERMFTGYQVNESASVGYSALNGLWFVTTAREYIVGSMRSPAMAICVAALKKKGIFIEDELHQHLTSGISNE